ncbi:Rho-GTPase-activating 6 [Apiospora phragmitis]|uniref:Rho-GTPase-activating 6 n=1 Tax=Apiospora phragmitis TaxID=2905665 RepID=A0ABR1T3W0_9PEZI
MQSHRHDTDPSSLRDNGKGKAVSTSEEPPPAQLSSFPKQAVTSRPRISRDTFSRPQNTLGESQAAGNLGTLLNRDQAAYRTSTTWTSSSGDFDINSEDEEAEDRTFYVDEYNKLARKHGIRSIVPGDFPPVPEHQEPPSKSLPERKNNWISRVLRQTSNGQAIPDTAKPAERLQHRRNISDIALNFVYDQRKAALRHEDLRGLVRLCGKSTLYLPADYAPGSLILPTCFRATAHYLIQHDERNEEIATTTRCPNLPTHLNCSVHDVASTFKRLLSGLPGGILGSLSLFDALVAIHSQLQADPESMKTKESKLRARLIALAIGTVKSRYRRELICAVFGILGLVGRVAELAPREDAKGKPLPTFDLMGYNALAIIFGPLLIGDLINSYSMKVADPTAGLVLLPVSPLRSRKQKRAKAPKDQMPSMPTIDRIHVANDITEMIIVHWREVVQCVHCCQPYAIIEGRPSKGRMNSVASMDPLSVGRQRIQTSSSAASHRLPRWQSLNALSPTAEESPIANKHFDDLADFDPVASSTPKSYKSRSRTENGFGKAELASSHEPSRMLSRDFLRDSASGVWASGSVMPGSNLQHSKILNGTEPTAKSQYFHENPNELDGEKQFDFPATLYETFENQRAVSTNSRQAPTSSRASRAQSRAPSAGKTPLKYERLPSVQKELPDLPSSSTEGQMLESEQHHYEEKAETKNNENLTRTAYELYTLQPIASESEEFSPFSPAETFPSFHPSRAYVEECDWPTPGKTMSSDKSSPWSLRHILGRKSPSAGQVDQKAERLTDTPTTKSSPISRWKDLVRNSPTSPLAALREKRLFRGSGQGSPHRSVESSETVGKKPPTPGWKQKLLSRKLEDQKKPAILSPDKKLMFEKSSQPSSRAPKISPAKGNTGSPIKAAPNLINRPLSQRSSSRPVGGAVKAMAALFDNASDKSPDGPLAGRSRSDLRTSASFASGLTKTQSPTKSTKSAAVLSNAMPQTPSKKYNDDNRGSGMASGRVYRTSVGRRKQSTMDSGTPDTPSTFPKVSLRPTGFVFSAARNESKISPSKAPSRDRELSRPPSLGTMVPPREEPPVAQHLNFIRRPSAASSRSHLSARPLGDDAAITQGSPLPNSGGRQLESKNEEVLQLRRQLETRDNMDVGTLSEKLREAKRDCAMWRDRAEAAERRIAVFEKFAAKARALRGGVTSPDHRDKEEVMTQEDAALGSRKLTRQTTPLAMLRSESDGTTHTEGQETFNERLRRSMAQGTRPAEDGAMSSPSADEPIMDLDLLEFREGSDYMPQTWRGRALWMAAEELLSKQDEMEGNPQYPTHRLSGSD